MQKLLKFLTRTSVLWGLGLSFLALTVAFGLWIKVYDLHIIDEIADPDQIRAVVAAMSETQRKAHWWMTLVLDYAYPLAYGGFFAGLAVRFLGRWGVWLALPALICIPADIIENTAQLFILSGEEAWLAVKAIATPIKLLSFVLSGLIALLALGVAAKRRFFPG